MDTVVGTDAAVRETARLIASDKVEGTAVRNLNGDKVGTIERVMIDKRAGKVAYAVMSFGGFLGMGQDYVALPWHLLRYNENLDAYELNITEDQLRGAPAVVQGWDNGIVSRDWERNIHKYYGVDPYWWSSQTGICAARSGFGRSVLLEAPHFMLGMGGVWVSGSELSSSSAVGHDFSPGYFLCDYTRCYRAISGQQPWPRGHPAGGAWLAYRPGFAAIFAVPRRAACRYCDSASGLFLARVAEPSVGAARTRRHHEQKHLRAPPFDRAAGARHLASGRAGFHF